MGKLLAALVETAKAALAGKKLLEELGFKQSCIAIYTDNIAAELINSATHPSRGDGVATESEV